jgi:hypothetical protein
MKFLTEKKKIESEQKLIRIENKNKLKIENAE